MAALLVEVESGRASSTEDLLPLVYDELRALAGDLFRRHGQEQTLQPTAVVHEAFIRLVGNEHLAWENRRHFFAVAATAMRNVIVDQARRRRSAKRGGDWQRLTLSGVGSDGEEVCDALDLDAALVALEAASPRQARIVELRFFGGLTVDEAARLLDVSPRTVELDWRMARAWLRRSLGESP
ncbi:MAG: sigma-70 family RNA polymerase sigma factor [Phycisphaerales bacterium]